MEARADRMTTTLITTVLKAWRFLYRRGFIEGFGHISARMPGTEHFVIARHSLGMNATPNDFLVLDMDGRKLHGDGDPPGEYPIHLDILRARPDVGSVIHYHGMHSTAFTTSGERLKPIHLMGTLFHDGIPVYPDPRLVSDRTRGTALANAPGQQPAARSSASRSSSSSPSARATASTSAAPSGARVPASVRASCVGCSPTARATALAESTRRSRCARTSAP